MPQDDPRAASRPVQPSSRTPRRDSERFDEPVQDWGLALRRLLPTLLRFRCPACGTGSIFRNLLYLRETCPHCGVRFEREPGGLIVSMVLNYFLSILILLGAAIFIVRRWGFADWLLPLLLGACVLLVLLLYRPTKAIYLWLIWLLGFVHVDRNEDRNEDRDVERGGPPRQA